MRPSDGYIAFDFLMISTYSAGSFPWYSGGIALAISSGVDLAIQRNVRTVAVTMACTVFGFCSANAGLTYMTLEGYSPPNTACVPAVVRVSKIAVNSPDNSTCVIAGSACDNASISPFLTAATAVVGPPTPMKETSSGFMPFSVSI